MREEGLYWEQIEMSKFAEWVTAFIDFDIPEELGQTLTIEEINRIKSLTIKMVNLRTFFVSMLCSAKLKVRETKGKNGGSDFIGKRDILQDVIDNLDVQIKAISRIITMETLVRDELHMSGQ